MGCFSKKQKSVKHDYLNGVPAVSMLKVKCYLCVHSVYKYADILILCTCKNIGFCFIGNIGGKFR